MQGRDSREVHSLSLSHHQEAKRRQEAMARDKAQHQAAHGTSSISSKSKSTLASSNNNHREPTTNMNARSSPGKTHTMNE